MIFFWNLQLLLFAENSGFLLQSELDLSSHFGDHGVDCYPIGKVTEKGKLTVQNNQDYLELDVAQYRDLWFSTSAALDAKQNKCAAERFYNYKTTPLKFDFPSSFNEQFILPRLGWNGSLNFIVRILFSILIADFSQ